MRDAIPPLAGRLRPGFWAGLDVAAAFALGLGFVGSTVAARPHHGVPLGVTIAIEVLIAAPIAFRRRWPGPALIWVLTCAAAGAAIAASKDPFVAPALVMYTAVLALPARVIPVLVAALAVIEAGVFANLWIIPGMTARADIGRAATAAVAIGGAWFIGLTVRQKRDHAAAMAEHAARDAVGGERLRIARELHDIIAHGLSLIAVQASVANYVDDVDPGTARRALASIEATSRASLRDLRHLLGVLRTGTGAAESAALGPTPGLADLPDLVRRSVEAGVTVELRVRGEHALPASVALSVYRIVQEALTNVIKHAPSARTWVLVDLGASHVRVEIANRGPGAAGPQAGTGHGLVGMRERVALFGGELHAAPTGDGGFSVVAWLPLENGV